MKQCWRSLLSFHPIFHLCWHFFAEWSPDLLFCPCLTMEVAPNINEMFERWEHNRPQEDADVLNYLVSHRLCRFLSLQFTSFQMCETPGFSSQLLANFVKLSSSHPPLYVFCRSTWVQGIPTPRASLPLTTPSFLRSSLQACQKSWLRPLQHAWLPIF